MLKVNKEVSLDLIQLVFDYVQYAFSKKATKAETFFSKETTDNYTI